MTHPGITIKVASSVDEIEALRSFWMRLNRHPEADIDFVLLLARMREAIIKPYVLAAYDNGDPVALLVGRLERARLPLRIGYSTLTSIRINQLVFVRDGYLGEDSERVASAMIDTISNGLHGCADRALLSNLDLGGQLELSSRRCFVFRRALFTPVSQHWITTLPADYEEFLRGRSKKHRYWLRRIVRIFEAESGGRSRCLTYERPEDVPTFCTHAETVARKTYQRGLGAGFVANQDNLDRISLAARRGWLRAYVAFANELPVAFWYAEQVGDVAHLIWTGFDPAYRKFEVGTIVFLKMLEDLMARGATTIDYGPGGAMYKERFGHKCSDQAEVVIYAPTPRALAINLAFAAADLVNRVGKLLLGSSSMRQRLKRIWRGNLAARASEPVQGATHPGVAGP